MRSGLIRALAVILIVIAAGFVAQRIFGDEVTLGKVRVPAPVATLESDGEAIGVAADGELVPWWPLAEDAALPRLPPLSEPPKGGRVKGTLRDQVRVLAAAPGALRPYLARSFYGESGVDVELSAGIELRFGDASQLSRKWKAAAAVLADPSLEAVDYVDLHAPSRPAVSGSGHALPAVP